MRLIRMMKSSTRLSSKHIYCLHVPSTVSGYKQIFFPADIDTLQKVEDIHQAIFSVFSCVHPFNFSQKFGYFLN